LAYRKPARCVAANELEGEASCGGVVARVAGIPDGGGRTEHVAPRSGKGAKRFLTASSFCAIRDGGSSNEGACRDGAMEAGKDREVRPTTVCILNSAF